MLQELLQLLSLFLKLLGLEAVAGTRDDVDFHVASLILFGKLEFNAITMMPIGTSKKCLE